MKEARQLHPETAHDSKYLNRIPPSFRTAHTKYEIWTSGHRTLARILCGGRGTACQGQVRQLQNGRLAQ